MREIKFRAWDNVKNRMLYTGEEEDVYFELDSSGIVATDVAEYEHFEKMEHLEYMQYTGLLDKNGREIYEGDIVNVVVNGGYRSGFEKFIKPVPVTYNEELACFDPFGWCVMWRKSGKIISAEVIGNIHENTDLLKEGEVE